MAKQYKIAAKYVSVGQQFHGDRTITAIYHDRPTNFVWFRLDNGSEVRYGRNEMITIMQEG